MQKLRPIYRYILISGSYLFLTAVFFTAGFFIGRSSQAAPVVTEAAAISAPPASTAAAQDTKYRVVLEDSELRLYVDENGISRMMSAQQISPESYPARDVAILREGIVFDNSEAALTLMENFLS